MRRSQAGFTLLELMVVVAVMGMMAAMLAPGLGEFMADARTAAASEDLVRISRHVRARSQESGLAHLLVFGGTNNDSGGLGALRVWEGMNNRCRQTPWTQTLTGTVKDGHAPVEVLDLGASQFNPTGGGRAPSIDDSDRQVIYMRATDTNANVLDTVALCFEPSGATWQGTANTTAVGMVFTRQLLPITFTVSRKVNGTQRGAPRAVVFQPGGIARFRF